MLENSLMEQNQKTFELSKQIEENVKKKDEEEKKMIFESQGQSSHNLKLFGESHSSLGKQTPQKK